MNRLAQSELDFGGLLIILRFHVPRGTRERRSISLREAKNPAETLESGSGRKNRPTWIFETRDE